MDFDVLVLGSGPGGYVAAIRASQLGMKTGVIEKAELGGVCLNWGCIPTKSLLKSAQVYNYVKNAENYGISTSADFKPDINNMVKRSREIAGNMSKGVQYLFKKNNIEFVRGYGTVKPGKTIEVKTTEGETKELKANHIIIATGARSKELPGLKQDGKKIIGYRKALTLDKIPESMVIVGSGAIGSEFAYFYNALGTKITLVEFMPNIVPAEDEEISKQLARSFKKSGIKVMTKSNVEKVETQGDKCIVTVNSKKGIEEINADIVLSAVGVTPNIEDIGLEETGIEVKDGKIVVDDFYKTNLDGYYAIGDVTPGQALAHVASAEGIVCIEKIAGHNPEPIDYNNIPGCTYCSPEVASVGYTEKAAIEVGYEVKIGKFPFMASGKASATGNKDGLVKIIFDKKTDKLLGLHLAGDNVTEMISEGVLAKKLGSTANDIIKSVHPHPTMSEAIMEAAAAAYDEAVHL